MFDFDVRSGSDDAAAGNAALVAIVGAMSRGSPVRDDFSGSVAQIPRRSPLLVGPSALVKTTFKLMAQRQTDAALVGSHGFLLGMVSARDVVRRMLGDTPGAAELPVSRVMESEPQTLLESDSIGYAIRKLWTLGGRPMPVVQPTGALSGLLETHDILAWLCSRMGWAAEARTRRG